jgi:hypothetical protein
MDETMFQDSIKERIEKKSDHATLRYLLEGARENLIVFIAVVKSAPLVLNWRFLVDIGHWSLRTKRTISVNILTRITIV